MNIINRVSKIINIHKKEFLLSGFAQIIYMSQTLFQNKIFAVSFDTDGFGRWSLLMSVYTLISMLPFTALDQGVYSIASEYRNIGEEKSFFSKVTFTYLSIYAFYLLFAIFYVILGSIPIDISVTLFMIYTITEILKNTYTLIDNAYRNRVRVLVLRIVDFIFRISMFIAIAYLDCFTINNVMLILISTNILAIGILNGYLGNFSISLFTEKYSHFFKVVFKFSLPLLLWALFGWLQNMIGRWYLNVLVDESSVALYTMLISISYFFPYAFYSVISTYIMPIIYSKDQACTLKFLFLLLLGCFVLLLLYFGVIVMFDDEIILLLADNKYLEINKYLPITTMSAILYVLAMLSTVEIYRTRKTLKLLIPTILPGLVMSTVGYLLIKRFQLSGAVMNYVIGQLLYCFFVIPLSYKSVKRSI